jgi:uncharacterized protein
MRPAPLVLFALLLGWSATVTAADAQPGSVTVAGRAHVDTTPDIARLSMAVERRNASMRAARDAAVRVSRDFIALCARLGIKESKVRTSGLTIQPEYRWNNDGSQPTLTGYYVQRQLEVELEDLDKLGELIEGAVDVGVNQVNPPQLDSSKKRERLRDALGAAAADARKNAEVIAQGLGVRLGPVVSVVAGDATPPAPPMPMGPMVKMSAQMEGGAADAASYIPGQVRFESSVNATFSLLAP